MRGNSLHWQSINADGRLRRFSNVGRPASHVVQDAPMPRACSRAVFAERPIKISTLRGRARRRGVGLAGIGLRWVWYAVAVGVLVGAVATDNEWQRCCR